MRRALLFIAAVCFAVFAHAAKSYPAEDFNPFTGALDLIGEPPQHCVDYFDGFPGDKGDKGDQGNDGPPGPAGQGVPAGGTDGQVLTKLGSTDYVTHWHDPSSSIPWEGITGTLSSATRPDLYATFEPKNANIQAHIANTSNPHLTTAGQVGAEPALGNPATDLECLQSYASGVRTWGSCGTGGGGVPSITYDAGTNTTTITGKLVIQ